MPATGPAFQLGDVSLQLGHDGGAARQPEREARANGLGDGIKAEVTTQLAVIADVGTGVRVHGFAPSLVVFGSPGANLGCMPVCQPQAHSRGFDRAAQRNTDSAASPEVARGVVVIEATNCC